MRMFRKDEGFTLVELMVVVLIIGILVAIAIPVFNAAQGTARRGACQNNLRVLDGATEQWAAESPANNKGIIVSVAAANTAGFNQYVKDWNKSTHCPLDITTVYTAASGDFYCPEQADHNYDGQTAP